MSDATSSQAAFLGDPNFPRIILDAKPGAKIANFQALYKTYSGLDLSHQTDRPFAIQGLEDRLLRALGVKGSLGVIDDGKGLLRRSLLWVRDGNASVEMTPIGGVRLPSWSWMAYTGKIDYLTPPPSGATIWQEVRLAQAPAATGSNGSTSTADSNQGLVAAPVRDIVAGPGGGGGEANLVYDTPRLWSPGSSSVKCVVLGVEKVDRVHYVLLVERAVRDGKDEDEVYRRVGAGYLPENLVGPKGAGTEARIE